MRRPRRHINLEPDRRAPQEAAWASDEMEAAGINQQQIAILRMAEHDALPASVRPLCAAIGNPGIAAALYAQGYRRAADAEARARQMLEARR